MSAPAPMRPLCMLVFLFALALCGFARAQLRGPAAPDSPAVQELLATAVGADASAALWLIPAARQLGLKREAEQLQKLLLDNYLRQLAGARPDPTVTVAQLLDRTTAAAREPAATRWALAINLHMVPEWASSLAPLPRQFDIVARNWKTLGPGLWHASRDNGEARAMVLALGLRNTSDMALALAEFRLIALGTAAGDIHFDCQLPSGEKALPQAPGQALAWLCSAVIPPKEAHPGFETMARQLSAAAPVPLRLLPKDFDDVESEQRTLALLLLAAKAAAPLKDFLKRNADCERRGDCHMVRPSVTERPHPDLDRNDRKIVPWTTGERVVVLAVIFLAIAVYIPAARRFGNRRMFICLWLVGALIMLTQWDSGAFGDVSSSLMGAIALALVLAAMLVGPAVPAVLLWWVYDTFFEDKPKGRRRGR